MRRAQGGDREAFGRLYESSWRPVFAHVAGQGLDADESRSIVQAVFLEAWRGIAGLRDPERFGAWIRTIATRHALRAREGRRETPGAGESGAEAADPDAPDPAAAAERSELRSAFLAALAPFPPHHREAILLRLLEGMKHREIGERLGLTVGQVLGIVSRGVRKLSEDLKRFMPEDLR